MERRTYEATLYAPLFYSSSEGRTIKTREILSSTALTHAIGYGYLGLRKDYVLRGDDSTTPTYERLRDLPLFVSDMTPLHVKSNERTFRSTDYRSERNFTTADRSVAKPITGKKSIPQIIETSGTAWQTIRNYMGIAPKSTFEFTVWTPEDLPESLQFRMGIKQSGEFRAEPSQTSEVILNKYMLKHVYEIPDDLITRIAAECSRFVRGNDMRLHHFIGVPIDLADEVAEEAL